MPNSSNFQELLSDFSSRSFVGRNEEIGLFKNLLTSEKPDFLVLGMSGQGGVGKTTLLELYKRIAEERNEFAGISNEDNLNIPDVLKNFENQFQHLDFRLKHFAETQAKYNDLLGQIESDTNAPPNLLKYILKGVTHFGLQSLKYVPVAGTLIDILEVEKMEGEIVEHSGEFIQYIFRKYRSKGDRALLLDTIASLTSAFVMDLDSISQKHKVVLIFDSFEKTQTLIEKWLLQLIDGNFGNFSSNTTFIISGRRKLSQKWTKYGKAIL